MKFLKGEATVGGNGTIIELHRLRIGCMDGMCVYQGVSASVNSCTHVLVFL